jgi:hypothetical protein
VRKNPRRGLRPDLLAVHHRKLVGTRRPSAHEMFAPVQGESVAEL